MRKQFEGSYRCLREGCLSVKNVYILVDLRVLKGVKVALQATLLKVTEESREVNALK